MAGFEARSVTPLECDIASTRLTRALCVPKDKGPSILEHVPLSALEAAEGALGMTTTEPLQLASSLAAA